MLRQAEGGGQQRCEGAAEPKQATSAPHCDPPAGTGPLTEAAPGWALEAGKKKPG